MTPRVNPLLATIENNLPTLPRVAWQVMQVMEDFDATVDSIVDLINQDQAIASRVLRLGNSAYYGTSRRFNDVSEAVVRLGFEAVRSLVLTAACESFHRGEKPFEQLLWKHAFGVSTVARLLARECGYGAIDVAATGGLIHDIGKLMMYQNLGEKYQEVIELVERESLRFIEAESRVMGLTHTEVGGMVVNRWNFSPDLEEVVFLHHSPEDSEVDTRLCDVVSLADNICVKLGVGPEKIPDLELDGSVLGFEPDELSRFVENVVWQLARIPSLRPFVVRGNEAVESQIRGEEASKSSGLRVVSSRN